MTSSKQPLASSQLLVRPWVSGSQLHHIHFSFSHILKTNDEVDSVLALAFNDWFQRMSPKPEQARGKTRLVAAATVNG
jgi:hypothetical protein